MKAKFIFPCMAIAAFAAFVLAPTASASPVLTSEGIKVPVGTSITAKNTGIVKFTGAITVECDHVHLTGTVLKNSGTQIEYTIPVGGAKFNGTGTSTDCTSNFVNTPAAVSVLSELCGRTVEGTDNTVTTGCGGNPVRFTVNYTNQGACSYSTSSLAGTFRTNAGATVNISEQEFKLVEGPFFCPTSGKLDGDFDYYTTSGIELTKS